MISPKRLTFPANGGTRNITSSRLIVRKWTYCKICFVNKIFQ